MTMGNLTTSSYLIPITTGICACRGSTNPVRGCTRLHASSSTRCLAQVSSCQQQLLAAAAADAEKGQAPAICSNMMAACMMLVGTGPCATLPGRSLRGQLGDLVQPALHDTLLQVHFSIYLHEMGDDSLHITAAT